MADHWTTEPGTDLARGQLMWPIVMAEDPAVVELAEEAQRRLNSIRGLDMVPSRWLHLTTLTSGPADDGTHGRLAGLTEEAQRLLADVAPVTVTLGRVIYHPRAVMLDAGPAKPFQHVVEAIQAAAMNTGHPAELYHEPWRPHITLAYSNSVQPAGPVIEALGRRLPQREVTIRAVSLVTQSPQQQWTWDLVTRLPLAVDD